MYELIHFGKVIRRLWEIRNGKGLGDFRRAHIYIRVDWCLRESKNEIDGLNDPVVDDGKNEH